MTTRCGAAVLAFGLVAWSAAPGAGHPARQARTFQPYAGNWVLDETASTGRLRTTPRIASSMTIATTPSDITVTKRLRLGPLDRASATPPPEIYRLDGTETHAVDERTGVPLDRIFRFTLVADMLALSMKEPRPGGAGAFTLVTDAYAVDGDVLTVHRQLSSVTSAGQILVMQDPANNNRHTFVYHRAP